MVKNLLWGRFGVPKVDNSDGVLVKIELLVCFGVPKVDKSDGELLQNKPFGMLLQIPAIPTIPQIPAIRCQEPLLGPSLPHAPGARMT